MSLVFALTLLLVTQTLQKCQPQNCPAGYFRKGSCGPNDENNLCEECAEGYYTAIDNTVNKCFQCSRCSRRMVAKKSCSRVSDVECVCKEGFYKFHEACQPCLNIENQSCNNTNCQNIPECKLILRGTTKAPTSTTKTSTGTTKAPTSTLRNTQKKNTTSTSAPSTPHLTNFHLWVILVILMLPVLYCLSLLFARTLYKYLHLCPRWRIKDDMEATDPGCHQSGVPTTLEFTFSEETPVMNVMSPAPSERPAHVRPLLPQGDATAAREQDPFEQWPAIVLYTVIKEVPLRRWKEFLRLLSVADQEMERVELDVGLSSMERQYQMLRLWSQRSSASMDDIFSALHYMELSGCAQMLKESLEKLQRVTA